MKFSTLLMPIGLAASLLLGACGGDGKKNPPKVNSKPVATSTSISTQADTQAMGALMGTDADNDMLSFAVTTAPTQGVLTLQTNGQFTYMPTADVTGTDQFMFTVSDGKSTSTEAVVNITINLLEVTMSAYTRQVFEQAETDKPLSLNSRNITQDVTEPDAFDDLLMP